MDKIREAYERACKEGLFHADSYRPGMLSEPKPGEVCHLVQFTAYDGYHVFEYCHTRKQADALAAEVNALGSVEAVDAFVEARREKRSKAS